MLEYYQISQVLWDLLRSRSSRISQDAEILLKHWQKACQEISSWCGTWSGPGHPVPQTARTAACQSGALHPRGLVGCSAWPPPCLQPPWQMRAHHAPDSPTPPPTCPASPSPAAWGSCAAASPPGSRCAWESRPVRGTCGPMVMRETCTQHQPITEFANATRVLEKRVQKYFQFS